MRNLLCAASVLWMGVAVYATLVGAWWTAAVVAMTAVAVGMVAGWWPAPKAPPPPLRMPGLVVWKCRTCGERETAYRPDVDLWCDFVAEHVRSHGAANEGQLDAYRFALTEAAIAATITDPRGTP